MDDWVQGLTLTVTNVSQQPVCFIHLQLQLLRPTEDGEELPTNDALMFACDSVYFSKPTPLLPGKSLDIVMKDSDYVAHGALLERNGYPPFVNKVELKVLEVQFFGARETKWLKGRMMRQDPDKPGDWHPEDP